MYYNVRTVQQHKVFAVRSADLEMEKTRKDVPHLAMGPEENIVIFVLVTATTTTTLTSILITNKNNTKLRSKFLQLKTHLLKESKN